MDLPDLDSAGIGERLRALRSQRGLTQSQVARRVSCQDATLSRLERGETIPTAVLALRLARLYATSVEYLLTGEDSRVDEMDVPDDVMREVERYLEGPYGASTAPPIASQLRDRELWRRIRLHVVDRDTVHDLRRLLETAETAALRARERGDGPSPGAKKMSRAG